jgi:hypothetical protein
VWSWAVDLEQIVILGYEVPQLCHLSTRIPLFSSAPVQSKELGFQLNNGYLDSTVGCNNKDSKLQGRASNQHRDGQCFNSL